MPTYNYRCDDHTASITKKITRSITEDEIIPECIACQKPMKRIYEVPTRIKFKGDGFYSTDKAEP